MQKFRNWLKKIASYSSSVAVLPLVFSTAAIAQPNSDSFVQPLSQKQESCGRALFEEKYSCIMAGAGFGDSNDNVCNFSSIHFFETVCPSAIPNPTVATNVMNELRSDYVDYKLKDCLKASIQVEDEGPNKIFVENRCSVELNFAIVNEPLCPPSSVGGGYSCAATMKDTAPVQGNSDLHPASVEFRTQLIRHGRIVVLPTSTSDEISMMACKPGSFPIRWNSDIEWGCLKLQNEDPLPEYFTRARSRVASMAESYSRKIDRTTALQNQCYADYQACERRTDRSSSCRTIWNRCERLWGLEPTDFANDPARNHDSSRQNYSYDWSTRVNEIRSQILGNGQNGQSQRFGNQFDTVSARNECQRRTSHLYAELERIPRSGGVLASAQQSIRVSTISLEVAQICKPLFQAGSQDYNAFASQEQEALAAIERATESANAARAQ